MLFSFPYEAVTFLPIYLAVEKGFFAQEGLHVDYAHALTDSKSKAIKLALTGEIAFLDGVSTGVEAAVRGWDQVKILCGGVRDPHLLMVSPRIERVADLKGKKVMAGGGRSINEVLYLCKQNGWEPGRDITILKGGQKDRMEVFQDPSIDAVAARIQFWHWAQKYGYRRLDYENGQTWYSGGVVTTTRMIQEEPEVVQKVVKTYVQSVEYLKKNREDAIQTILKNVPYLDNEGATGSYDVLQDIWNPALEPSSLEYMAEVLGVAAGSTYKPSFEDMTDLRFLRDCD